MSTIAQIEDEASCQAYYLDLGKETFQLKGKDLMKYVTEQVRLWSEKRQFIQQREDKIKEAALARETAERELARMAAQATIARETAERELAERLLKQP